MIKTFGILLALTSYMLAYDKVEMRSIAASNIDCSKYKEAKHIELIHIEPLSKDATNDEIIEYSKSLNKNSEHNSKAIIHNNKIYFCWQSNYFESIVSFGNAHRDHNISKDSILSDPSTETNTSWMKNTKAPSINAGCSIGNASFTLYKGTRCSGGGTDMLEPRCIEYIIKKNLGFDISEAKHYNHKEALSYLEEQAKK